MTSHARNTLIFLTIFGLLTYVVAIEPRNWLGLHQGLRNGLNFPALAIIATAGYLAFKRFPQAWPKQVWLLVYGFELIMLVVYGVLVMFYTTEATAGLRNFTSSLRHWLISPLPFAILVYLSKRR